MTFQIEITPIAESQIEKVYQWYRERNPEFADRWFRELMNAIATLQEKPRRFSLAVEHQMFNEEVRQLLYGKSKFIVPTIPREKLLLALKFVLIIQR